MPLRGLIDRNKEFIYHKNEFQMRKSSVFIVFLICAAVISCASKNKTNSPAVTEIKNIQGHYIDVADMTAAVDLIITKDGNTYKYEMTVSGRSTKRSLKGTISFSDDPGYFYLDGIRWAYHEIDEVPQEPPESVGVQFDESNEIKLTIQNRGGNSMNNVYYVIFDDIDDIWINLRNKYVTWPNGITADARIPQDIVDMMFARFEAIENGDIAAFRSTLGEMQDGVDYYDHLGMLFKYFGGFFDIDADAFDAAVASGGEELREIENKLFYGEHPLRKKNTGLLIKRLEFKDTGGLRVIVINKENKEFDYHFSYW